MGAAVERDLWVTWVDAALRLPEGGWHVELVSPCSCPCPAPWGLLSAGAASAEATAPQRPLRDAFHFNGVGVSGQEQTWRRSLGEALSFALRSYALSVGAVPAAGKVVGLTSEVLHGLPHHHWSGRRQRPALGPLTSSLSPAAWRASGSAAWPSASCWASPSWPPPSAAPWSGTG